jgi:hypothetical protein
MPMPRVPDEVKRKRGSLRLDRQLVGVPSPVYAQIGEAPDYMNESQKLMWDDLRNSVASLGVTAVSDLKMFEMMVYAVDKAFRLQKDPEADFTNAQLHAMKFLSAFGMSPQARSTVKVIVDKDHVSDHPMNEFVQ